MRLALRDRRKQDQGTKMLGPMDEAARMKALNDGRRLMAERRLDDAQMVAAELVASLPDDAEVHAFLGDVMDELGRTEEAVAAYERAVAINPESQLDRIRLVQLRRKLENTDFDVAEPVRRRRMNVPALAAGSVLMACVISAIVLARGADNTTVAMAPAGEQVLESRPFNPPPPVSNSQPMQVPNNATRANQPDEVVVTNPTSPLSQPVRIPGSTNQQPGLGQIQPDNGFSPLSPNVTISPNQPTGPTNIAEAQPLGDPDPIPEKKDPPKNDPGVVEITSSNGSSGVGNSEGVSQEDRMRGEALYQAARESYTLGDNARAADLFNQAIRAGYVNGGTYHRLAKCYQNLGRRADAIKAYERAVALYEQSQTSNPELRRRNIEECRQAIRILQGS